MSQDPSKLLTRAGVDARRRRLGTISNGFVSESRAPRGARQKAPCRPPARKALGAAVSRRGEGVAEPRVGAQPSDPERAGNRPEIAPVVAGEVVEAAEAAEMTCVIQRFSAISMTFLTIAVPRGRQVSSMGGCAASAARSL
jgi:hypothetical protein